MKKKIVFLPYDFDTAIGINNEGALVFGYDLEEKALKARQGAFFKSVYQLLIDREKGPRLYLFLFAIEPEKYAFLLDFSTPKTEEEAFVPEEKPEEPAKP